jgi:putative inorganic carbon (hco3(-)) transporter
LLWGCPVLRTIAFVVAIVAAFGGSIVSPFWALASYIWFALFRPQEWVWVDISALRLSLVLGIMLLIRALLSGAFPVFNHRLALACVAFWLTGLVAQINAVRPDIGWEWLDFMGRLTIVALLVPRLADSKRRFTVLIAVIACSIAYYTAKAGLAFLIGGGVRYAAGLAGPFSDNNAYALAGVMILPMLVALWQNRSTEHGFTAFISRGFLIAAPLTCLTVVGTFSRAGFLSLVVAIGAYILMQRRRMLILGATALVAVSVIPFVPLPDGYIDRLKTIRTYEQVGEESAISRFHFWRVAGDMAIAHPLGIGLRNFNETYDQYDTLAGRYGTARSVHSSHLQVLAENGFDGAAVWIFLFVSSYRTLWRIRRDARAEARPADARFLSTMSGALMVSMTAFLVGGSFIAMSLNDLTWLTFGLVIALDRLAVKGTRARAATAHRALAMPAPVERVPVTV